MHVGCRQYLELLLHCKFSEVTASKIRNAVCLLPSPAVNRFDARATDNVPRRTYESGRATHVDVVATRKGKMLLIIQL